MKLYLGKEAGFCWGVKRAINLTEKAIKSNESKNIYTYGPLIHNPQVVEELKNKGVKITNELLQEKEGTLIVRAHGIPPQKLEQVKNTTGLKIIDGTCPHVTRSEKKVAEFASKGYHIIIVGDPDHAEVISLQGFASYGAQTLTDNLQQSEKSPKSNFQHPSSYSVVTSLEMAKNLKIVSEKIFIIAQSTYNIDIFHSIIEYFKSISNIQTEYFNSICSEPVKTQEELKKMCKFVDCVIVVGGKNSANTKRLEEIVVKYNREALRIETEQELDIEKLKRFENIGITAGASTPDWIIEKVVNKIKNSFNNIELEIFDGTNN